MASEDADDRSTTETSDSAEFEVLVTVPDTVTVLPGRATCGLTELMTTDAGDRDDVTVPSAARAAGIDASMQALAAVIRAATRAKVTVARATDPGAAC